MIAFFFSFCSSLHLLINSALFSRFIENSPCVVTRVFFCACHSCFRSYYITKAFRTFLGGYQGQMLLFPRRNRLKSWRSFYAFSLPFARENHACNMKLMKKRFTRLGISKNSSSEFPTSYFFVEMLRNICFEMRIKCGGNLKVLVPFWAFGKTLTLSDVLNGASNHGAFHKTWDSDFFLLRWSKWP